jgi:hypothetical protein
MLTTLMLKPKPFRQPDSLAAAAERYSRLTVGQHADPGDFGALW